MKNRGVAIILMLLACVPILLQFARDPSLLFDTDTNVLIFNLNQRNDPLYWFSHDWPLENHFYRPISTLAFEMDNRLHPGSSPAFGFTNALICSLCVLGTAWFVTEIRRSLTSGVCAAWLAMFWTLDGWFFGRWWMPVIQAIPYVVSGLVVLRMLQDKKFSWQSVGVAFGSYFLVHILYPINRELSARTMDWLPGRTATVMTIFTMIALASYVRFERLGAPSAPSEAPSALDEPATRTSSQNKEPKNHWAWLGVSFIATALALGSYEQAVMIPFVIFFIGIWLRTQKLQTRFAFQIVFWMLLLGYILLRVQVVPVTASKYQSQQFRSGPGLWIDILNYVMPFGLGLRESFIAITTGLIMIVSSGFWNPLLGLVSNFSAWVTVKKKLLICAIPLVMATVAYLPMAFLKQFGHYHYWPAMLLTLFVIVFFEEFWKQIVTAVSPQAVQAPPRSDRAPGSLPRL